MKKYNSSLIIIYIYIYINELIESKLTYSFKVLLKKHFD